MLCR